MESSDIILWVTLIFAVMALATSAAFQMRQRLIRSGGPGPIVGFLRLFAGQALGLAFRTLIVLAIAVGTLFLVAWLLFAFSNLRFR